MKYLSRVCLAVAFVALAVPGSAKTSLTPGQSAKVYRTVIAQGRGRAPIVREQFVIKLVVPMPVARKRIEDSPGAANGTLVTDALAVPDAPANTDKVSVVNDALAVTDASADADNAPMVSGALAVQGAPANTDKVSVVNDALAVSNASANTDKAPMVNGALAVQGAPANTDTTPAKFSPKNAADDELITIARTFKMLTQDERRVIYEELKHQAAPNIGTKLPPGIELQPVP